MSLKGGDLIRIHKVPYALPDHGVFCDGDTATVQLFYAVIGYGSTLDV